MTNSIYFKSNHCSDCLFYMTRRRLKSKYVDIYGNIKPAGVKKFFTYIDDNMPKDMAVCSKTSMNHYIFKTKENKPVGNVLITKFTVFSCIRHGFRDE